MTHNMKKYNYDLVVDTDKIKLHNITSFIILDDIFTCWIAVNIKHTKRDGAGPVDWFVLFGRE